MSESAVEGRNRVVASYRPPAVTQVQIAMGALALVFVGLWYLSNAQHGVSPLPLVAVLAIPLLYYASHRASAGGTVREVRLTEDGQVQFLTAKGVFYTVAARDVTEAERTFRVNLNRPPERIFVLRFAPNAVGAGTLTEHMLPANWGDASVDAFVAQLARFNPELKASDFLAHAD